MKDNILKLKIDNKTKHLEKYKASVDMKTYLFLTGLISALTFTIIDLEINFIDLFSESTKYFSDILIECFLQIFQI